MKSCQMVPRQHNNVTHFYLAASLLEREHYDIRLWLDGGLLSRAGRAAIGSYFVSVTRRWDPPKIISTQIIDSTPDLAVVDNSNCSGIVKWQLYSATNCALHGAAWEGSDCGADADDSSCGSSTSGDESLCSTACCSRSNSLDLRAPLTLPHAASLPQHSCGTASSGEPAYNAPCPGAKASSPPDASVVPPEAAYYLAQLNQPYHEPPVAANCPGAAALRWAASMDERREHHLSVLRRQLSAVLRRVEPRTRVVGFAPTQQQQQQQQQQRQGETRGERAQREERACGSLAIIMGWEGEQQRPGTAAAGEEWMARVPSRLSLLLSQAAQ